MTDADQKPEAQAGVPTALEHEPLIPPIVVNGVPPLPPEAERFIGMAATDVADLVGPLYTMSPEIVPLYRMDAAIVGRALTAKAWPGDNLAIHGALGIAQDEDILVVDWRGYTGACGSGAQSLIEPFARGLRAVVIDGGWRDAAELEAFGFPVFARSISPWSPPKVRPGEINVTVHCGGVVVEPGDLVVADTECVAVVPRALIARVADAIPGHSLTARTAEERRARSEARANYYRTRFAASGGIERTDERAS